MTPQVHNLVDVVQTDLTAGVRDNLLGHIDLLVSCCLHPSYLLGQLSQ